MSDEFAAPPSPDGRPAAEVRRAEFRPVAPRRRRGGFPRWLTALLAAGGLVIIAGVVAQVALTVRNNNLVPADAGATGRMHSAQVVSGMCLMELGDSAGKVVVVPCAGSHAAEVVSSYTFTADAWPGDEAAARAVLGYCATQLAPGGPLATAAEGRGWVAWVPSQGTWNAGDRKGLCIVHSEQSWNGRAAG